MTVKRVTVEIPVDVVEWCVIHNFPVSICDEVDADYPDDDQPMEEHKTEMIVRITETMRYHLERHIENDLKEIAGYRAQIAKIHEDSGEQAPTTTFHPESDRVVRVLERHLFINPDGTWRFPTNQTPEQRLLDAIFNDDDAETDEVLERHLKLVPEEAG